MKFNLKYEKNRSYEKLSLKTGNDPPSVLSRVYRYLKTCRNSFTKDNERNPRKFQSIKVFLSKRSKLLVSTKMRNTKACQMIGNLFIFVQSIYIKWPSVLRKLIMTHYSFIAHRTERYQSLQSQFVTVLFFPLPPIKGN